MNGYALTLGPADLIALPGKALFWPDRMLLIVSDLHLGKSERLARRGGALLPPYDTTATLARLTADLQATGAKAVICLGDSFDDTAAGQGMDPMDARTLSALTDACDWTWVLGNHDPQPGIFGGRHCAELTVDEITFRHIADQRPGLEVSGHYHPKIRLAGQARACFVTDGQRLILPSYGVYTGGLWCDDPAISGLFEPDAIAILTGKRAIAVPL